MLDLTTRANKLHEEDFEHLLSLLDDLRDAVIADRLERVVTLDKRALLGWLQDIFHTAHETMQELENLPLS